MNTMASLKSNLADCLRGLPWLGVSGKMWLSILMTLTQQRPQFGPEEFQNAGMEMEGRRGNVKDFSRQDKSWRVLLSRKRGSQRLRLTAEGKRIQTINASTGWERVPEITHTHTHLQTCKVQRVFYTAITDHLFKTVSTINVHLCPKISLLLHKWSS